MSSCCLVHPSRVFFFFIIHHTLTPILHVAMLSCPSLSFLPINLTLTPIIHVVMLSCPSLSFLFTSLSPRYFTLPCYLVHPSRSLLFTSLSPDTSRCHSILSTPLVPSYPPHSHPDTSRCPVVLCTQMRSEIHKSHASDPNLNQISRSSPTPGFRPRSLTFSFTHRYRSRRRRMSLGARAPGEKSSVSITHSTQLSFLDFMDLFKSFGLRCRKDLKELFEQIAVPRQSVGAHDLRCPPFSPKDKDMSECCSVCDDGEDTTPQHPVVTGSLFLITCPVKSFLTITGKKFCHDRGPYAPQGSRKLRK